MRNTLLCIPLLTLLFTGAIAQPAPDFSIVDSQGNPHMLYSDYLDQGKTVMIKIFFTNCPPCNTIAPWMEPLYQDWGAGQYDVEFFDLSDKDYDTDNLVNAYKQFHGHTYPAAGVDGGSLEAVQPYKSGMFGVFTGTPTFIVIAPDGSVNFNIHGFGGTQGTIDAIDEAIAATGAMKPDTMGMDTTGMNGDTTMPHVPEPVVISGTVRTFAGFGIQHAVVSARNETNGEIVDRDTTGIDGVYTLSLDSAIVADHILTVHVEKTTDPLNGVTPTDLIAIQKHNLRIELLDSAEKLFAADVNYSGTISVLDIVALQRLLLGIAPGFDPPDTWLFFHMEINLGAPGLHPPLLPPDHEVTVQNILAQTQSPAYRGVKLGDVNHSADPLK